MKTKERNGITLIALVVTIVVLLILAGITISMVLGDGGIISKTTEAKEKTEKSTVLEAIRTEVLSKEITEADTITTSTTDYLIQKGIMREDGTINVDSITQGANLGRGNLETGDYYQIVDGELTYTSPKKETTVLGKVYTETGTTTEDIFTYADADKTILTGVKSEYVVKGTYWANALVQLKQEEAEDSKVTVDFIPAYTEDSENKDYEVTPIKHEYASQKIIIDGKEIIGITIPDRVVEIADGAFNDYISLQEINLGTKITKIGKMAFDDCHSLKKLNITDNITSIGESAFSSCYNLQGISIPSKLTKIEQYTFSGCSKITSATIPNTVTEIGDGAFYNCRSLKTVNNLDSEKLQKIGSHAFYNCDGLQNVVLSNTITEIGASAFSNCDNLESINIPNKLTRIESNTFAYNYKIKNITIPSSVMNIDNYAFGYWNSDQIITVEGKKSINDFSSVGEDAFWSADVRYSNAEE